MRPHRRRGDYVEMDVAESPETAPPTWTRAVERFLRDARSRNCSPATIHNYRTYLLGPRAEQFRLDYQIESVADITPGKLRDFQADLLDAGLSAGTAATFHRIIRNFLGFCRRQRWGVGADTLEVAPPQQASVEPETYSEAEERRILAAARTGRDRFLVEFMVRTGLRLSEVTAVTTDDVITGPEGSYLRVQGKGRKDRIVPLDTGKYRFSRKLNSYVRNERPANAKDLHLFLSNSARPDHRRLCTAGRAGHQDAVAPDRTGDRDPRPRAQVPPHLRDPCPCSWDRQSRTAACARPLHAGDGQPLRPLSSPGPGGRVAGAQRLIRRTSHGLRMGNLAISLSLRSREIAP